MRILQIPTRHEIRELHFSPDGSGLTVLYHGRTRSTLGRLDFATGKFLPIGSLPFARPISFAYSPDGEHLGVGSNNGQVQVFRFAGMQRLAEISVDRRHTSVAFSPSLEPRRRWVAAAGREIQLRNLATGEVFAAFEPGDFSAIQFGADGNHIFATDHSIPAVIGWTIKPFAEVLRVPAYFETPRLAVSPLGDRLAVADFSGLRVIRLEEVVEEFRTGESRLVADATFTRDGRSILAATGQPAVQIFDAGSGAVREFDFGIGRVTVVAVSADGLLAAAGGEMGKIVVWDLDG